jgi:ATP-dependent helicase/nuclease subunit B
LSLPKVFTIAAGLPFVDVLAAGIQDRVGNDPAELATATVLVPTQRSRRSLADAFLRHNDGRALLLPRIIALGDMDEDEVLFNEHVADTINFPDQEALQIPEALAGIERQLMLTKLVLARKNMAPDQAVNLGLELARLLDQVHTERLSFSKLATLVPEEYADHWRETLEFLTILTEAWPKVLKERSSIDAAERRNLMFDGQVRSWTANPPSGLVIAAGSTGSIPSTANLLSCIARLENGSVVLPGLDRTVTKEAWGALKDNHPQFGMAHLLKHIGVNREDVSDWQKQDLCNVLKNRSHLIQAALTPASFKTPSLPDKKEISIAIEGITRIDCPTPREEAAIIALMMRQAIENPKQTAALVTPDRSLARRVATELSRWNIEIDDSAGIPLAQTPPGSFLRLIARMFSDNLAPASLLAALKHPLAAGGMATQTFRSLVRDLEISILRGPRPAPGIDGLLAAIKINTSLKREKNHQAEVEVLIRLRTFIKDLQKIFEPFMQVMDGSVKTLVEVVNQHVHLAEALASTEEDDGADRIWSGDAGKSAALFISEIINYGDLLEINAGADYPAMLHSLMAGRVVRPSFGRHPRLNIWGLLEARLQQADVMILSGLNETVWPPEAKASPWMSYPMLIEFGLPTPERRIGLAAHDFTQAFCSPQIVLTRSLRVDGTPTVPSRWLLRLVNLLEQQGLEISSPEETPWLHWMYKIDAPKEVYDPRLAEPSPRPPVTARPRKLPVTSIETWLRDPYAIYARNILELRPLNPLDTEPDAAERGIIIHKVLEQFQKDYPSDLPEDAEKRLLDIGREIFDRDLPYPSVRAFWWPRFKRIVDWFIAYEKNNRSMGYKTIATEVEGSWTILGLAGDFTLTARADRIDTDIDQNLIIIDYKTGSVPSAPQVKSGLTPQLSLEGAIAKRGGFNNIKAAQLSQLIFLRLSGSRIAGKAIPLIDKKLKIEEIADEALKELGALIAHFDDAKTPYLSSRKPMFEDRTGYYDHLARVKEWRGQAEAEDE